MEPELPPTPIENETPPPSKPDTLTFKRSTFYAILVPLAFVAGLAVGYLFWGRPAEYAQSAQAQIVSRGETAAAATDAPQQVKRYQVPIGDAPTLGPADAPITLIELSDYQCPYCKRWFDDVYPQLMKDYTGKIRFVYKDFPLYGVHPEAEAAAEAAHCAAEQTDYWKYHDKLFAGQSDLGEAAYKQFAQELGLDLTKFEDCLSSHRYQDTIRAEYQFAADLGVTSTPTFFINGLALVGAQPYEVFKQVIDKELAGEIP